MNNLNIHGRHPNDLPDKETIEDILLELKDTHKFEIKWIELVNSDWYANSKSFYDWIERGEVVTCEMDKPFKVDSSEVEDIRFYDFGAPTSYVSVKETRYDILRNPIRLDVAFTGLSLNFDAVEIIRTSTDVYLRLKDYLEPDVIQDQTNCPNFMIDFMLTSCRIC